MREYPIVFTLRLSEAQVAELKAKAVKSKTTAGTLVRELITADLAK